MNLFVIDVGGTFIKYAVYQSKTHELSHKGKVPTPTTNQTDFLTAIEQVKHQLPLKIDGIALSLPGTIDTDTGYVSQGGSLRYNDRVNLKEIMEDYFACPVTIENDARCAALAEIWQGNLKGVRHGLVLVLGTGLGGAIVIDGKIYKGAHLYAGELSIFLTKNIRKHGNSAILGMQVSIPRLMKHLNQVHNTNLDGITLLDQIQDGDAELQVVLDEYLDQFSQQLFNFQMSYDPEVILIGGGISQNPYFYKRLLERMSSFYELLPIPIPHVEIKRCRFENDANLLGAVKNFMMYASESRL
ncbi:ROK family protein [Granulicatella seriolae]|uniref:ROK family protein n=1 Tax=Granulicatella seriolae TaxID=2967226 RepID=A0ABT1WLB5_9LACT|nr:ROK family protein [Granulicatella seriolae]